MATGVQEPHEAVAPNRYRARICTAVYGPRVRQNRRLGGTSRSEVDRPIAPQRPRDALANIAQVSQASRFLHRGTIPLTSIRSNVRHPQAVWSLPEEAPRGDGSPRDGDRGGRAEPLCRPDGAKSRRVDLE